MPSAIKELAGAGIHSRASLNGDDTRPCVVVPVTIQVYVNVPHFATVI